MNKEDLFIKAEEMRELMGDDLFVSALLKAMDSKELEEDLEFIDRMNDLEIMD